MSGKQKQKHFQETQSIHTYKLPWTLNVFNRNLLPIFESRFLLQKDNLNFVLNYHNILMETVSKIAALGNFILKFAVSTK